MSEYNRPNAYAYTSGITLNEYIRKIFALMAGGLGVTTVIAALGYFSFASGGIVYKLLVSMPFIAIILLLAEIGCAVAMSAGITRFSTGTCTTLFFVYSALTGITFSVLPMSYGISTVFTAFLFAAVLFVCCAVIGYTTNVDLTKFSGLLMGALLALVIMTAIRANLAVYSAFQLYLDFINIFLYVLRILGNRKN